jgi:hypothetical protein
MGRSVRIARRGKLLAHLRVALVLLACACGDDGTAADGSLCTPDSAIFCRCPAGDPGEKTCNATGDAFGECEGCDDRPPAEGGSSAGVGGGPPGEGLPLYRACSDGAECESGLCNGGYCTINCEKVSDCEFLVAECVPFAGSSVCRPLCESAIDCEPFGAPPSLCGFAPAIDNWGVTVCASWGSQHELVPNDSDCAPFEHGDCNLGYAHRAHVCTAEGICADGCFGTIDCPEGESCSSDGSALGACN